MDSLSSEQLRELALFKRQYLQLQADIRYPSRHNIRAEAFQQALNNEVFSEDAIEHHPPGRYQMRVLKELMRRIESSITDWDQDVSIEFCSITSINH
jgi:hypothetical protein